MKHKKTAIAIAVAGLMGLSPYAIAGEGWGDKAKQKMESAGDSVERGAETTTEKVKGFFDKIGTTIEVKNEKLSKNFWAKLLVFSVVALAMSSKPTLALK